jgi:AcrR family transcriptional regulator
MSPRPYNLGRRQESAEQTRTRIVEAARELLMASDGFSGFTMEAVARQAGVARMTVYYQFESKRGLLDALSDMLAARGLAGPLEDACAGPDPIEQLDRLVSAFCRFWASDRVVIRRLRSLAALDCRTGHSAGASDRQRRNDLRTIGDRLATMGRTPSVHDDQIDILHTLTSFEVYDMLAGTARGDTEAAQLVARLVKNHLGLARPGAARPRPGRRNSRRFE